MSRLYSAMLRLEGRTCVVAGGGKVATRKVKRLLESGARVVVISPECGPDLAALAEEGLLSWKRRSFCAGDLQGAALAFAATSSRETNAMVAREAECLGVPVNVADDPAGSSFHVPSVVARGDITIAIATGGQSPAFARRLREDIEAVLVPERLELLELYAELRSSLRDQMLPSADASWHSIDASALDLLRQGRRDEARRVLRKQVVAQTIG
jgi:siroheme synthase-like protein